MTPEQKQKEDKIRTAYRSGVDAHKNGELDDNPYGVGDMMQMCAWSAGYFDSMRGMV